MSMVDFELSGFTGTYVGLNTSTQSTVTFLDVQRAITTVGSQPNSPHFPFGAQTVYKNVALSAMALCVLDFNSQSLTTTALFRSLDGSEKGSFSYWFGMAFSKIAVERYMAIPWLTHVDPWVRSGNIVLAPNTNSRGDFVGLDMWRDWHAFEAKGRSQRVNNTTLQLAKQQAGRIDQVFLSTPATSCASGVSLGRTPVHVHIEDPQKGGVRSSASWPPNRLFEMYYRTLAEYLRSQQARVRSRFGLRFRMAALVDATGSQNGFDIGIPEAIFLDPGAAPQSVPSSGMAADANLAGSSLGLDGVLIEKRSRSP